MATPVITKPEPTPVVKKPETVIIAKGIEKTYHMGKVDVNALCGVSFEIQKGEVVSIMGPS